jgi:hypothetical protein
VGLPARVPRELGTNLQTRALDLPMEPADSTRRSLVLGSGRVAWVALAALMHPPRRLAAGPTRTRTTALASIAARDGHLRSFGRLVP